MQFPKKKITPKKIFDDLFVRLNKAKMYDLALVDAEKTVALAPAFAKGYHRIAVVKIAMGKNDEAKAAYKSAIKIEPNNQAYKQLLKDLM